MDSPDPCLSQIIPDDDVVEALRWQAGRTVEQIIHDRECIIQEIESLGDSLWSSGQRNVWVAKSPKDVRKLLQGVNGPLIDLLASKSGHSDQRCADMFQTGMLCLRFRARLFLLSAAGAPLYGQLECAGIGLPVEAAVVGSMVSSQAVCMEHNAVLLASLGTDEYEDELFKLTLEDAEKGRMTAPVPGCLVVGAVVSYAVAVAVDDTILGSARLHPRFAVEQGLRLVFAPACLCGVFHPFGGRMVQLRSVLWTIFRGAAAL